MFRVFLRAQIDEIRNAIGLGSEFSIVERLLNKESRAARSWRWTTSDQLGHIVSGGRQCRGAVVGGETRSI
jgi:hypothetical protein